MALLEISDMSVHYGRISALSEVSMSVEQGEIVSLIGANGAGKTTTMRAISGIRPLSAGRIFRISTEINAQGTTVRLVEQNAQQALTRAHRAYVLEAGQIVKTGSGKEMLADPSIKQAYLGVA